MARNIRATFFMTLDGVVESPEKWSFAYWNDEIAKLKNEELKATDALLLGRVTYEGFAAAWPGRKDEEGFADKFNNMPKYVVTNTVKDASWNNSHILNDKIPEHLAKLKAQPGGDIMVHGSGTLVRWLMRKDLLDGLRLLVYPLVRGEGKRLFTDAPETRLRLVTSRTFKTGVVELVYERGENVPVQTVASKVETPPKSAGPKTTNGEAEKGIADRLRYKAP